MFFSARKLIRFSNVYVFLFFVPHSSYYILVATILTHIPRCYFHTFFSSSKTTPTHGLVLLKSSKNRKTRNPNTLLFLSLTNSFPPNGKFFLRMNDKVSATLSSISAFLGPMTTPLSVPKSPSSIRSTSLWSKSLNKNGPPTGQLLFQKLSNPVALVQMFAKTTWPFSSCLLKKFLTFLQRR